MASVPTTSTPKPSEPPELEEKVGAAMAELAQRRKILDADELASLISPRAHFELAFERLADASGTIPFLFSIDGILDGHRQQGMMFAGQCILVYASGYAQAQDLANRGLRSTIELLHEEYQTRHTRAQTELAEGTGILGAGRKAGADPQREKFLHENRFLVDWMAHKLGGEPWKG